MTRIKIPTEFLKKLRKLFTFKWVRTFSGVMKLAQLCAISLAIITVFCVKEVADKSSSSIEFFLFINSVAWIIIVMVILLKSTECYYKLPLYFIANAGSVVCCGVATFLFLISSIVIITSFNKESVLVAAGTFGLISTTFFLVELFYRIVHLERNGPMEHPF